MKERRERIEYLEKEGKGFEKKEEEKVKRRERRI